MVEKEAVLLVPSRIQSPSSITTYNKCPRKYYYSYIAELPSKPNIHQIRGSVAHAVLDKFFLTNVQQVSSDTAPNFFRNVVQDLLVSEWKLSQQKIRGLGVSERDEMRFFEETLLMVFNWLEGFVQRFSAESGSVSEIFHKLTPLRELSYVSDAHFVRGIIDVIEQHGSETRVMDYKTSNHSNIEEYRLQLAIYSLLFFERHKKFPDKVGIYFLKDNTTKFLNVDQELLDFAKREIELIHQNTFSKDKKFYPKHISSLCKWSTGQCDFYDVCVKDE
ncbi:PD-(D/E)XK nuclease family protein [Candidatus Woesearchaeota archaeon]|nr:PD-(D/E)XK nuclease family protein [Candidatus Woesearchaeota archaeon]